MVLFDGNPSYPDDGAIWKLIEDEKITIFGTSASYINYIKSQGLKPGKDYDLSSLREISQTGSPLSAEGFEYVYQDIKKDLHFNSISGGTDINGCFAGGNIISPVYAGELQGPALAMKMKAYDEKGNPYMASRGSWFVRHRPLPCPSISGMTRTGKNIEVPTSRFTRTSGGTETTSSCTKIREGSLSTAVRTRPQTFRSADRDCGDLQRGGSIGGNRRQPGDRTKL